MSAQTTTPVSIELNGTFVLGETEDTYTGTGSMSPFGNVTLNATSTFSPVAISFTFTLSNGDILQATSGTPTSNGGGSCSIQATVTGGTGEFTNATGSLTLNYACSNIVSDTGSFAVSGSGSVTTANSGAISAMPSSLAFSFLHGGAPSSSQPISLGNGTQQSANFSVTTGGESWLSVSPASGSVAAFTNTTLSATVQSSGLAPGTYTGSISIAVSGGPTFAVAVTVTVGSASQVLELSQTSLRFRVAAGAGTQLAQSILVLNPGTGSLNWTAKASTLFGSWLSVAPGNGVSGSSATVSVDPTNLAPGDYYGIVQFSAAGASNSPQSVVVVLNVLAATTVVTWTQPTALIFVGTEGGANPAAQIVTVTNSSDQPVTVTASTVSPVSGLFSTNLASATIPSSSPAQFTITANFANVAAGVYNGFLVLQFPDGATTQVELLAIVTAGATPVAARISGRGAAGVSNCTPTKLLPVSTALAPGFDATAAWPTALDVTVVDDCGSPMGPGDVIASFSTGDTPVPLLALGNGNWSATWQPSYAAASTAVVITLAAQSAQPVLAGTALLSGTLQANDSVPVMFNNGVVSTASFAPLLPLAPGAFASIFGKNLASSTLLAATLPLTSQLAGAQAIIGGELAPIEYASSGQLNILIPYDLSANSTQQLIVQQGLALSTPQTITIAPAQPAVFKGTGAITVVKPDGTQFANDAAHPASAGDALVIYCAGLGAVSPAVETGMASPGSPAAKVTNRVTATIGKQVAPVMFAGLSPGFAGLYQVNVTVPSGIEPGTNVPLVLTSVGLSSPPAPVAIQ